MLSRLTVLTRRYSQTSLDIPEMEYILVFFNIFPIHTWTWGISQKVYFTHLQEAWTISTLLLWYIHVFQFLKAVNTGIFCEYE